MVNATDEAWRRYVTASLAQMHVVAALNDLPDIGDCERRMGALDTQGE